MGLYGDIVRLGGIGVITIGLLLNEIAVQTAIAWTLILIFFILDEMLQLLRDDRNA